MSSASSSQNKSWWRSKPFKDVPTLRTNPSHSSLASEARMHAQSGPPKQKESKFNTFVSTAIGKKTKKPTLTIQDPPTTYVPPSPSSIDSFSSPGPILSPAQSPYYTNRPPAKSVSTERSYEFDRSSDLYTTSEPRTPSDHVRDRTSYQNSLMAFHDPDPFAAGAISVSGFSPDMNRLSVWSDNSLLDPHSKRGDLSIANRTSYASSSSNSHGHSADIPTALPQPRLMRQNSNGGTTSKRRKREASLVIDGGYPMDLFAAAAVTVEEDDQLPVASKSSPASPLVPPRDVGTFGRPAIPPPRPMMPPSRSRGQTIGGERPGTANVISSQPRLPSLHRQASESHIRTRSKSTVSTASPIMFSSARSSISTGSSGTQVPGNGMRPLVLVRKASQPRVNLPPLHSAPPSSRLPPPPLSPFTLSDEAGDGEDAESLSFSDSREPRSSTSSGITFASIELDIADYDDISVLAREMIIDDDLAITPPATARNMSVEPPPRRPPFPKQNSSASGSSYHLASPPSTVLRKAASQSSMHKRISQMSVASASSLLSDEPVSPTSSNASSVTKAPRKQRSFHHPRIPLPPLPALRHGNHSSQNPPADSSSSKLPFNPNNNSPSYGRRRLFSGSSTRRTSLSKSSSSPPATADDDLRSLSSLSIDGGDSISRDNSTTAARNKPMMLSFANMGNQISLVTDNACIAPAWEEMGMGKSAKRLSQYDYVPQRIMAPADMLRLEEQFTGDSVVSNREHGVRPEREEVQGQAERTPKLDIDPGDFGMSFIGGGRSKSLRSRTDSLLSNMSAFGPGDNGGGDEVGLRGLVGVAQTFGTPVKRPSTANDASRGGGWSSSTPRSNYNSPVATRPSTAQPSLASPPISPVSATSISSEPPSSGLPPPPRPRASREKQREPTNRRTSMAPLTPLSPPPRVRAAVKPVTVHEDEEACTPTSQTSRPPSAFGQKAFNRRSLAKKPSFLDIEDEYDNVNDTVSLADMSVNSYAISGYSIDERESSFLDLDRGTSFDTVRSYDDDIRPF
ncbi:hypothetical protein BDW22DRAFT_16425 [Trametopsis cervina]|nr:hypothetical protein BDW22DRAFT_16425 [Trametopsis cervina]